MTFLLVDDREPAALARRLAPLGAAVRRLDHGDVHVGAWVVERKTVGDFVRSLADGRLFAQAAELRGCGLAPLLALEGAPAEIPEAMRPAACGALATLAGTMRIPVVPTADLEGTASLVRSLLKRRDEPVVDVQEPLVKLRRADPYVAMLAQAPGVGAKRAEDLARRYPSFAALSALRFTGLVDAVGPKTAASLWRVLHGRDVPEVYARLGTGKRARALVDAFPELEDGGRVGYAEARRVVGKAAAAKLHAQAVALSPLAR